MPGAAAAALAALGAVGSALGIYSFFDDAIDNGSADTNILNSLQNAQDQLADLQDLAQVGFKQSIAAGMSQADTAISDINRYLDGDSTTDRDGLEASAVQNATSAMNSVIAQTEAIIGSASIETLAYAFGALHYTMVVRQTVANIMEDGPLGSPGLTNDMKEAASLLYDWDDGNWQDGIAAYIENLIPQGISQSAPVTYDGPQKIVRITTTSENTGHTQTNTVAQEGAYDWIGIWWLTETEAEFDARVTARRAELREDVVNRDRAEMDIDGLKADAVEAHNYLAHYSGNGADYETIGTSNDDSFIGTSRSDFLSGRQGDDELWGGRDDVRGGNDGPDALSGGAGNDILRGGDMNDVMRGGAGNDMIIADDLIGQMGSNDVARFEGLFTDYVIDGGTTYATVTSLIDGARDKVFGVEHLRFDDGVHSLGAGSALDDAQDPEDFVTAEIVALLYEAALNRDGNIDRSGLNFYIDVAEQLETEQGFDTNGVIEFLAKDLMTSPEFSDNFGNVNTLSNEEFLQRVYENVLDRTPDREGYEFYLQYLDLNPGEQGHITKEFALADIAISAENVQGSTDVLMSLYETTTPEVHETTGITLDWYFVA